MSQRTLPGIGLTGFWDRGADYKDGMDQNLLNLSALTQLVVESRSAALPASPTDGQIYIVPSTDTSNPNKIAIRDNGAWTYLTPMTGWRAYVKDAANNVQFSGSTWSVVASGGGSAIAIKDEGTTVQATPSAINFVGAGVTASDDGAGGVNVTIAAGSGSGGTSLENALTAPPTASNWIQQNFDATKTHLVDFSSPVTGVRLYEDAFAYGNTNSMRYALRAIPGTRWDVKARLRRHTKVSNFMSWGLVLRDSATGRSMVWGFCKEAAGLGFLKMTNDTTYNSYAGLGGAEFPYCTDIWLRLRYDGDCTFQMSADGVWWRNMATATGSALWGYLTNPATHIGFGYNSNNAGDTAIGQEVDLLSWQATALA